VEQQRPTDTDVRALAEAFEAFTQSTQTLEETHRLLEKRIAELSENLAAKNQELALTNDYLNYILESMSDGVITVDNQGIITTFNQSAGRVLGYSADEVEGKQFHTMFSRPFSLQRITVDATVQGKTGRHIPISERDAPIYDRRGTCIGYVKVFQDLTEVQALREQVRQMDRLAALGEMAATVAHEIRNPLGGIRGFASLLARDIAPDDPRARLVNKILTGVRDLDRVVSELLEYTRPVELHRTPITCADLINSAVSFLEYDPARIAVANNASTTLRVMADADKMRQVFLNLLINAAQSIELDGAISIETQADDTMVTITVGDTGCGISEPDLKRIFSPFFTTKEKGSGLGLAVAAKIVEGHLGTIDAHSEPGKGSTFIVRLPRTE